MIYLLFSLRICSPCLNSSYFSRWLCQLASPHFPLTSTSSSLVILLLFSTSSPCVSLFPLISWKHPSFLGLSPSLCPLQLHPNSSLLLPFCRFSFTIISSCLNEPAGGLCGDVWSEGSWAWLNCSKIAASLQRLHYLNGAAPHRVCETHTQVSGFAWERKVGLGDRTECVHACVHIWSQLVFTSNTGHDQTMSNCSLSSRIYSFNLCRANCPHT